MPIVFGVMLLFAIYIAYKLFIDGWLFKGTLFIAGWFGIYIGMLAYVDGAKNTAMTIGQHTTISWAALVPTIVCVLCLLCTKVYDNE